MIHYRVIGSLWLLFGTIGFVITAVECVRLLQMDGINIYGAMASTLLVSGFCALAVTMAIGLIRDRAWSRLLARVVAVLLMLYCLSFILMVALEFGSVAFMTAWLGVIFGGYTLIAPSRLKQNERNMAEPSDPPNDGPATPSENSDGSGGGRHR
jgi:hypothetical protein